MSSKRNIKRVTSRTNVDKKNRKIDNKIVLRTSKILEKEQDENKIAEYGFKNAYVELKYEEEETYRTNLRRQRDKILYTGGFRRLQDKTQVLAATKTGDHRTRLTHTLEVEQIAISIADALGLNTDLVSAIALGHDVGHTPFGHAGERKLDELLKDDGRFHHPIQSVKYLWLKYGDKISYEVYEGILKHDSDMYVVDKDKVKKQIKYIFFDNKDDTIDRDDLKNKDKEFQNFILDQLKTFPSTLEAQTVVWADKIAYISYDLEDYIKMSKYNIYEDDAFEKKAELNEILKKITNKDCEKYEIRDVLRSLLNNLITGSKKNIDEINVENFKKLNTGESLKEIITDETNKRYKCIKEKDEKDKKRYLKSLIINFESEEMLENYTNLKKFLTDNFIKSTIVKRGDYKAGKIVEDLYNNFNKNKELLPVSFEKNNKHIIDISDDKDERIVLNRVVANYISTMGDGYAKKLHIDLNTANDFFEQ